VIDTPAGLHGRKLVALLGVADIVLVPLQPSLFDIQATHRFLAELREHPRAGKLRVGLVGMRVKDHTIAQGRLQEYVDTLPAPMVAAIRDTQNYVHLAAHGLTLWDVGPSRVERDLAQWAPLLAWLDGKGAAA
jgi:chromosome partitioning protein